MLAFELARHLMFSRTNADGGISFYYYYDVYTWIAAGLGCVWLTFLLVRSYRRRRALRRRPRNNRRMLKRVVRIKRDVSWRFLQPGLAGNIHAVGIGRLGGAYCIQVFINSPRQELWPAAGAATLPPSYLGVPIVLIEMPMASFLSSAVKNAPVEQQAYPNGIRERQEVIVGGISGANANLTGQSGTIGYFCTRKSRLRRKEVHLLSNSHVFVDLRKGTVDDGDLIMQPSPGEPANNRPIASLVDFSKLTFAADLKAPNHVDAAIAKLWGPQPHKPLIPLIGAVKGYVEKKHIELGETARKFGRTTGYTEGRIFSIYLDIWIRYDRTGQSAYFQDQFLIEPTLPGFSKFVAKGDSGSLVVDAKQHATGLVFGGMSEPPAPAGSRSTVPPASTARSPVPTAAKVENYGVANPISEVLDHLKIDLLV
jgi:hypothetical protein